MKTRNIILLTLAVTLLIGAGMADAGRAEQREDDMRQAEQKAAQEMATARELLNRERYEQAAQKYAEAFQLMEHDLQAGNALYWEAFARYRLERTGELKRAAALLRQQQEKYATAETAQEGEALLARVRAELARRGDPNAARQVEEGAGDEQQREETRIFALHALMESNPERAIPILEDIVTGRKSASDEFRRNAIFVLCRIEDSRAEDVLINLLQTTEDAETLSGVVMCLSMKESDRALDAMVDLFHTNKDAEVGEAVLHAIGRQGGDRAFTLLTDVVRDRTADMDLRQHALFSLAATGRDDEVAELAIEVLRSGEDREMQEMALMTLSRTDSDVSSEVLLDLINDENADDELRSQALFFAARNDAVTVPFLRQVYEEADEGDLRLQVCHVLTEADDQDAALDLMLHIARNEKDPDIRQNVIFWVGRFDDQRATDFLLELIDEE